MTLWAINIFKCAVFLFILAVISKSKIIIFQISVASKICTCAQMFYNLTTFYFFVTYWNTPLSKIDCLKNNYYSLMYSGHCTDNSTEKVMFDDYNLNRDIFNLQQKEICYYNYYVPIFYSFVNRTYINRFPILFKIKQFIYI